MCVKVFGDVLVCVGGVTWAGMMCMFVCICVYVYVYMCAYMCVCMCVCV